MVVLLCTFLSPGVARAKPPLPMLSTDGARWVDADGRPVLLRGCNLGNWLIQEMWMHSMGTEGIPDQYTMERVLADRFGEAEKDDLMGAYGDSFITARDFRTIKSFGMNVVRLPIWYRLLEHDSRPLQLKPDAWIHIDRAIDLAEAEGLYTILDLHGAPGGQNPWHHSGRAGRDGLWRSPQDQERTVWLWRQIAARYRHRSAVAAYDVLNEPFSAPKEDLKELVYAIYHAIRAADPHHIVIFPGQPDGFEFYGKPSALGITNVAFTMHFYPGFFGWGEADLQTHVDWLRRGAYEWRDRVEEAGVPLLVGEMNVVMKGAGGAEMMRHSFDTYGSFGWGTTMWSYKVFSSEGDAVSGTWGMVTNRSGSGAPLAKLDTWNYDDWDTTLADSCVQDRTRFTAPGSGPVKMYLVVKAGAREECTLDAVLDQVSLQDDSTGSEMVTNGGFGSGSGWSEWRHQGAISTDYAHTGVGPSGGVGPALRLSGTGPVNGGIYQAVSLHGGRTYRLRGATRDAGSSRSGAWLEVYLRTDAPIDGRDYVGGRAQGTSIDLNTSSLEDIREYFHSLSRVEYVVYEDLRHWLTTDEPPRLLPSGADGATAAEPR
jgi:glucan 1,3-beta-glucosidase